MNHPADERLAEYLDGALDLADRAAFESHLAFCQTCRSDVEAARTAREALVGMPSVPAPRTDLGFIPGLSPEELAEPAGPSAAPSPSSEPVSSSAAPAARVRPQPTGPRGQEGATGPGTRGGSKTPRSRRSSLGPILVGVAAAAVGLVVVITLSGNHSGSETSSANGSLSAPLTPITAAPEGGQDFTAQSFASFAKSLAREAKQGTALRSAKHAPTIPAASGAAQDASATDRAVACVQRGTGLASGTHLYFTEPGTLDGQPVYVVALIDTQSGHDSLLVVAVTVDGCQPLQVIHQAL
jgi:hypothetical protein